MQPRNNNHMFGSPSPKAITNRLNRRKKQVAQILNQMYPNLGTVVIAATDSLNNPIPITNNGKNNTTRDAATNTNITSTNTNENNSTSNTKNSNDTNYNHDHQDSGLQLSLNYNELTNVQFPTTTTPSTRENNLLNNNSLPLQSHSSNDSLSTFNQQLQSFESTNNFFKSIDTDKLISQVDLTSVLRKQQEQQRQQHQITTVSPRQSSNNSKLLKPENGNHVMVNNNTPKNLHQNSTAQLNQIHHQQVKPPHHHTSSISYQQYQHMMGNHSYEPYSPPLPSNSAAACNYFQPIKAIQENPSTSQSGYGSLQYNNSNRTKMPPLTDIQFLPKISNTAECSSNPTTSTSTTTHDRSAVDNMYAKLFEHPPSLFENTDEPLYATNSMIQRNYGVDVVQPATNNPTTEMLCNDDDVFLEPSEDGCSSSEQTACSSKSGGKQRIVASSVGRKVNGRYTKLRKQLTSFGGDFTDNYFVFDAQGSEDSSKNQNSPPVATTTISIPKTGRKRKSTPTEEESAVQNNRINQRSYTISSSDYANNMKMISDMQNIPTVEYNYGNFDNNKRRSSIGPISQSSFNPQPSAPLMIPSINNQSYDMSSINRNMYTSTSLPQPGSISFSRDQQQQLQQPIPAQPVDHQTNDSQSVHILLSLLLNSVQQDQKAAKESNINFNQQQQQQTTGTLLPQSSSSAPQMISNFHVNNNSAFNSINSSQNNPNTDLSFQHMFIRPQGNNK